MKILVIQQKMIGDVLTSSILFEALKKEFPEAELHYLIYAHTAPVVENNPYIDKLILFDDSYKNPLKIVPFLFKLKRKKYDVVIDVYSKISTAFISAFTGAQKRIGYKKWYTKMAYNHVFSRDYSASTIAGKAVEKRLNLLSAVSPNFPKSLAPKIFLSELEINNAKQELSKLKLSGNNSFVMISVLGSSESKTYPKQYLAVLIDQIAEETNAHMLFNYIPSQKEDAFKVYKLCKPVTREKIHLEIFGKSLREFLAFTSICKATIGNEGGAINMSKALGIPTFAIFSPPINKENWNMFDDNKVHVSIHLRDFKPESFENLSKKDIKTMTSGMYESFKPSYIAPKLSTFLQNNLA